jgi:hypothetical protein
MSTDYEQEEERRLLRDRRQLPTSGWLALVLGGRRSANRRANEHEEQYFVDNYSAQTLFQVVLLLALSIADAAITLLLIQTGCEEINPVMNHLLEYGLLAFLIGKYVLTASGIPLLLVFKNYYLFGTRFRVGYLLPVFIGMYLCLISYQACLFP